MATRSIPDFFDNDAFGAVRLTQQLLDIETQYQYLCDRLPFEVTRSETPDVAIAKTSTGIGIVPAAPRGAPGVEFGLTKKSAIKLTVPHYPVGASINSSEVKAVLNQIGANGELLGVEALHQRHLAGFDRAFANIWELGAQGMLEGVIRNPDGEVVADLGELYGEVAQEVEVDFTDPNFDYINLLEEAKTASIAELGGFPSVTDWLFLMVGPAASAVRSNKKLLGTKDRVDDSIHSADKVRGMSRYRFCDDVELKTYQFTRNMPTQFNFDPDEGGAFLLPIVRGLYDVTFTPTENFDGVNGPGLDSYADVPLETITKSRYRLEAETNFIRTVKKPKAIIRFKQA